jgi:ribosomal protein S18 acetylase RimI-like enzyme
MDSIRPLRATDLPWATRLLDAELGGRLQARRGELVDVLAGPALVAWRGDQPIGIVSWFADSTGATAEVRVLLVAADARGEGVGRLLIDAAVDTLREAGVGRAWLVTTNDNLAAVALYQKCGWRLARLRPGAIDEARRTLKPGIPKLGEHDIPLRDELELELIL